MDVEEKPLNRTAALFEHEDRVNLALEDIKELGMSVADAARKHDIKVYTLRRRMKKPKRIKVLVHKNLDFLSEAEEALVVHLLRKWENAGVMVSSDQFLEICRRLAAYSGKPRQMAGGWQFNFDVDWLEDFIKDHPEVDVQKRLITPETAKTSKRVMGEDLLRRYAEMLHKARALENVANNDFIVALHGIAGNVASTSGQAETGLDIKKRTVGSSDLEQAGASRGDEIKSKKGKN